MDKFISSIKSFAKDEEGLTVVEYVIGAALLVGGLTIIFDNLGSKLSTSLNTTIDSIS
ncbi:hypothetical protein VHA01S_042_00160 [Vibrio halioticoli NBRC 102217]|uniref:Fimbrial protein n=1 Tax=Vibrio halioticoli NBRC 102217 TaxID=1219072 RepID=V5HMH2_9VIBR|nr:hypothetical protein [Vibrio halioticoli]GAD90390.1 hypothetical protein VHA01S_042_00160 [Vibrio halioticoli NBRC 102217]